MNNMEARELSGIGSGEHPAEPTSYLELDAIPVRQRGIPIYLASIRIADIFKLADIERWMIAHTRGYQRELSKVRSRQIADFMIKSKIWAIPPITLSVVDPKAEVIRRNGRIVLRIPARVGSVEILDGQHRIFGAWFAGQQAFREGITEPGMRQLIGEIMDSDFSAQLLWLVDNPHRTEISRALFVIYNETQRRVPVALRDILISAHNASSLGLIEHPVLEPGPRVVATQISLDLSQDQSSPLKDQIKLPGLKIPKGIPISAINRALMMLFDRLEKMVGDALANKPDQAYRFVLSFLRALNNVEPSALSPASHLRKATQLCGLMLLAIDVYSELKQKGKDPGDESELISMLSPLKGFDFTSDDSPIKPYAGTAGIPEVHKQLRSPLVAAGKLPR